MCGLITFSSFDFEQQMILWDTTTGQPLARLLPGDNKGDLIIRASFVSGGKRVVGATSSGMLRSWDVEVAAPQKIESKQ